MLCASEEWNTALDKYDPPKSAVVWIVWLLGQIIVSVLLTMLSGFHFWLVRHDLCDSHNVSNFSNVSSNSTGGPTCGFSAIVLVFAIVACIASIVDGAVSLHYLTHKVLDKPEDNSNNENQCKDGAERLSCCSYKVPSNTLRVLYCWILVHVILIFVATNTYEWSWQTDEFSVLVSNGIFFLTTTMYVFLIVAMVMWHGCCYTLSCCCKIWREENDGMQDDDLAEENNNVQEENNNVQEENNKVQNNGLAKQLIESIKNFIESIKNFMKKKRIVAPLMTAGLIASNTLCMVVTLVVFFCFEPDYSKRAVGLAFVLVYIFATSIIWWFLLVGLYMRFDASKHCKIKSCIIAVAVIITILLGGIIPALIEVVAHYAQKPLFGLLFFILPFVVWIAGAIIYCKSAKQTVTSSRDGYTGLK